MVRQAARSCPVPLPVQPTRRLTPGNCSGTPGRSAGPAACLHAPAHAVWSEPHAGLQTHATRAGTMLGFVARPHSRKKFRKLRAGSNRPMYTKLARLGWSDLVYI